MILQKQTTWTRYSSIYHKPQPKSKLCSSSQQMPTSTPAPAISVSILAHMSLPASLPPPFSPDINLLNGLPLMILPAPAHTKIMVPLCALSHLQTSFSPPSDDSRTQQIQWQAIQQGFCYEEPASGTHGLLTYPPAAAKPSSPVDSSASASTFDDPSPSLQ